MLEADVVFFLHSGPSVGTRMVSTLWAVTFLVIKYRHMAVNPASSDLSALRNWLHDVNNRMGAILASAELLQLEQLPPQAAERRQTIEDKALEVREILRAISDHYFS